jgi:hypothetical protein
VKLLKMTRVTVGLVFVFTALVLSGCAQKTEVTAAKVEPTPAPPPPKPKIGPTGNDGNGGGLPLDAIGGLLGGNPTPGSATEQALLQKYKTALVGTWTADLGMGVTEELTYNPDGTFHAKLTGSTPASETGKYTVLGLVGTKGLKIQLATANPKTIRVTFEDNELQHPTLQPGVTGVFHKK